MHKSIPLDALYETLLVTDENFIILDCNTRAVELFGEASADAFIGSPPGNHVIDFKQHLNDALKQKLATTPFVLFECNMRRSDGSIFVAETAAHHLGDAIYCFSVRDITARKEDIRNLTAANERLKAQARDRIEFVSNVSHELRTPLTSMSYAITNMLRGLCGPLPEKAVAYLERLKVDARRLMETVNDILDMRQLEQGTLSLRKVSLPIKHTLSEVADALIIQTEAKHQRLTLHLPTKEYYISADRHKFERILFNILSNAIKYTPDGGEITITLSIEDKNGKSYLSLIVDDSGIGIPKEALHKVARRFFRVGDHVAGTGLGLSIVRELVDLHDGTFHIDSPVPGTTCGTRVTISIPLIPGPLAIIFSGDEIFIQDLREQLECYGNSVIENRSAIDIAKECANMTPALFFIDGSLPDSLIADMICQLHAAPTLAQIPIHVLAQPPISEERRTEYATMRVTLHPWPSPLTTLNILKH